MEKISITRALTELKLLDKRIVKETENSSHVGLYTNRQDQILDKGLSRNDFEVKAKASLQSIHDLIERRKKVKCAILISNASVKVKIGAFEYFVIEAIERKNSISYDSELLAKWKRDVTDVVTQMTQNNTKLKDQVDQMLNNNLGSDKQVSKSDYDSIAKPMYEQNEMKLSDPIGIENKIDSLDKEIDEFLSEVDFVLSESNARTEIEI